MVWLHWRTFQFALWMIRDKMIYPVNPPTPTPTYHDDVIKWKHFPRNWPFVREIHRSPVNFPHKGQWRGALMFSLIYAWINDWVNNREASDLRRQYGHYDVIVMYYIPWNKHIVLLCVRLTQLSFVFDSYNLCIHIFLLFMVTTLALRQ